MGTFTDELQMVWPFSLANSVRSKSKRLFKDQASAIARDLGVHVCVCVRACVKCFGGSNRGKRNRSSIEEERSKEARIGPSHRGSSRFAFFSKATRFKKVNIH